MRPSLYTMRIQRTGQSRECIITSNARTSPLLDSPWFSCVSDPKRRYVNDRGGNTLAAKASRASNGQSLNVK